MNIGRVHSPPISTATGIDPSTGGIGAEIDYWKCVHPCNVHHEGYRPHHRGYRGTR